MMLVDQQLALEILLVINKKPKGLVLQNRCLWPEPCKNLKVDHEDYLSLLTKLRQLPNVKKVFVRSGIRYKALSHV